MPPPLLAKHVAASHAIYRICVRTEADVHPFYCSDIKGVGEDLIVDWPVGHCFINLRRQTDKPKRFIGTISVAWFLYKHTPTRTWCVATHRPLYVEFDGLKTNV